MVGTRPGVHDLLKKRNELGAYNTLVKELQFDNVKFQQISRRKEFWKTPIFDGKYVIVWGFLIRIRITDTVYDKWNRYMERFRKTDKKNVYVYVPKETLILNIVDFICCRITHKFYGQVKRVNGIPP